MTAYVPADGHQPTSAEFHDAIMGCRYEAASRAWIGPFGMFTRRKLYRECMYRRGWTEGEPTFRSPTTPANAGAPSAP